MPLTSQMVLNQSMAKMSSESSNSTVRESTSLDTPKSVTLEFDGKDWFVEELPLLSDSEDFENVQVTGVGSSMIMQPVTMTKKPLITHRGTRAMVSAPPPAPATAMAATATAKTLMIDPGFILTPSPPPPRARRMSGRKMAMDEPTAATMIGTKAGGASMRGIPVYMPTYHHGHSGSNHGGAPTSAGHSCSSATSVESPVSSLTSGEHRNIAGTPEMYRKMAMKPSQLAPPVSRVMTNAAEVAGTAATLMDSVTSFSVLAEQLSRIYGRTPMEEFRFRKKCPRLGIPPQPYVCHRCGGRDHFIEACQSTKTNGPRAPPPDNYICHKCNTPGHWISDCPLNRLTALPSRPPTTYVCHNCGIPGHWIKDCPVPLPESRQRSMSPLGTGAPAVPVTHHHRHQLHQHHGHCHGHGHKAHTHQQQPSSAYYYNPAIMKHSF